MSRGEYVLGSLELILLVGALGIAAYRVRAMLLPDWSRSPARLVEVVVGLAAFTMIAELLGVIGLLKEGALLLAAVLAGVTAEVLYRRRMEGARERGGDRWMPTATPLILAGAAIAALAMARWLIPTQAFLDQGMWAFDTMHYHLPLAARFAQAGSLTSLHFLDPVNLAWFFPANSELLHTAGILVFDRDIVSPLINLGWLALAMLAAWCIGRPYGVAPLSLAAAAIVLVTPALLARQPGNAHTDIAAIALLLASAAILLTAFPGERVGRARPGPGSLAAVVPAALAAGLAAGTKLNLLAPVIALTVAVLLVTPRGARRRAAWAWFLPLLATGAFWYLRNLFSAGNPLPFFERAGPIGLPAPERVVERRPDNAVAHYLTDTEVWDSFFFPGLDTAFGPLWVAVLILAYAGIVGAVLRGDSPMRRALAITALAGSLAYLFTPHSAAGLEGSPAFFGTNLRWIIPMLALGLALLPTLPWARFEPIRLPLLAAVGVVLLYTVALGVSTDDPYFGGSVAVALAAVAIGAGLTLFAGRIRPAELAVSVGLVGVLAISLYWGEADEYLDRRYASVWSSQRVSESFRWAEAVSDARIGIAGTTAAFLQYGYYGDDISNVVEYIGRPEPHGGFSPIESCQEWRERVNGGDYDYLVTSPTINPNDASRQGFAPEASWLESEPAVREILRDGDLTVHEVTGRLDPRGCTARGPLFVGLPPFFERR